jgi:hypothetical protein
MNQFCTQCGTKLAANTMFCTQCGAAVATSFAAPVAPVAVPPPAPIAEPVPAVVSDLPPTVVKLPETEQTAFSEPEVFSSAPQPAAEILPPAAEVPPVAEVPPAPQLVTEIPPPVEQSAVTEPPPVEVVFPEVENPINAVEVDPSAFTPPAELAPAEEKPPLSKGKKALIAVASVFMAIILFAAVVAGQSWFILQNGINNETVSAMARGIIDEADIATFPIFDYINSSDFEIESSAEIKGDEVLHQAIFNSIDDYYKGRENSTIDESSIKKLLDHRALRNFLGDIVQGGVEFILGGDDKKIVNPDKLVNLIENERNQRDIAEITGYELKESDVIDIENVLINSGLDSWTWRSAFEASFKEVIAVRNFMSFFNSVLAVIIIAAAAVLMIVLLFVINRRRISNALLYFGIPCLVCGLAVTVFSFLTNLPLNQIASRLELGDESASAMKTAFSSGAGSTILLCGIIVLSAGVLAIVAKVIISAIKKKKQAE